ncbi:MAG TPA: AAA family ATPase [Thermoanaerobaculia bacterium]|nr:AAA family ATPase [Thermoanaerobaculia bacterium]
MTNNIAERRLYGIAVYNPDLLSKHELVAQFVARRELFAEFVADLHRPKFKQHQLIVGHRGMGKTTFLRRLRYAVEDDAELSRQWIALIFPEEQYNVSRLSDLYLNCIDALGDALERTGRQSEADALDEARERLPETDEARRAAAALDLLMGTAKRLKRRLLLLIDNLDLILERLDADQWTIRELLSREDRLLLIGATPFVIGATYTYDAPFYDFFRVHELRGLSFEETAEVLATLARETNAPGVERLVREEPARIRTLHVLAGGNPRTIVLLFSVLAQGTEGDVRSDLEKLLDQTTPLYKARFESLAQQAQQVVDALAIHWDPISAGELAEGLRLDVNVVSSQLNRLVQQGVVEKVPYDPASKIGFQIAERFFNIWYLMRASRRVRRRLTWLVQFLRLFYGLDQLHLKARDLLRTSSEAMPIRQAELCLALAEALGQDRPTQLALESRAIKAMLASPELSREMQTLFDLDGADAGLRPLIDRQSWAREFRAAIDNAPTTEIADLLRLLGSTLQIQPAQKLIIARELPSMSDEGRQHVRRSVTELHTLFRSAFGPSLLRQVEAAVLEGYVVQSDDEEGFSTASAALNMPALKLLRKTPESSADTLDEIARSTDEPLAWAQFALVAVNEQRLEAATDAVRNATAGQPGTLALTVLAEVEHTMGRNDAAVTILKATLHASGHAFTYRRVAQTYRGIGEHEHAYRVLEEGLSIYPQNVNLLRLYGMFLKLDDRHPEAQRAFEKLVSIAPDDIVVWANLVDSLTQQRKFSSALEVIEQGLERHRSPLLAIMRVAHLTLLDRHEEAVRAIGDVSVDESLSLETSLAVDVAEFMLSVGWESALPLLSKVLPRAVLQLEEADIGTGLFSLFRIAANEGHADRAATLLEELGLQEPLRPIYETLKIRSAGDRAALNRLAPELRDPVMQLLDEWEKEAASGVPEQPKKVRKTRGNVKRKRRLR